MKSNYRDLQAVHAVAVMRRARGVSPKDVAAFERRNVPKDELEAYYEEFGDSELSSDEELLDEDEEDRLERDDPDQLYESESYDEEREDI